MADYDRVVPSIVVLPQGESKRSACSTTMQYTPRWFINPPLPRKSEGVSLALAKQLTLYSVSKPHRECSLAAIASVGSTQPDWGTYGRGTTQASGPGAGRLGQIVHRRSHDQWPWKLPIIVDRIVSRFGTYPVRNLGRSNPAQDTGA